MIPEIEMPGHSEEVLTAYPELSCTGEPYRHSDFCVGKEATFTFLENVLTEVIDLFPSESTCSPRSISTSEVTRRERAVGRLVRIASGG